MRPPLLCGNKCDHAANGLVVEHPGDLNGLAHPSGNVICDGDEPGYGYGGFDEAAMCVGSSRASP